MLTLLHNSRAVFNFIFIFPRFYTNAIFLLALRVVNTRVWFLLQWTAKQTVDGLHLSSNVLAAMDRFAVFVDFFICCRRPAMLLRIIIKWHSTWVVEHLGRGMTSAIPSFPAPHEISFGTLFCLRGFGLLSIFGSLWHPWEDAVFLIRRHYILIIISPKCYFFLPSASLHRVGSHSKC